MLPKRIPPPVQVPLPVEGEVPLPVKGEGSSNQPIIIDSAPEDSEGKQNHCFPGTLTPIRMFAEEVTSEISDFSDLEPFYKQN